MSSTRFIPYDKNRPFDVTTTFDPEIQIWQELTMLRYLSKGFIRNRKATAPYIDQAKVYYHDARASNWKTSGLLYYYSFLNLAKAFILSKGSVNDDYLKSTSIYHGLSANPQELKRIIDFMIEIHPPETRRGKNVFALLYQDLTNESWPFAEKVEIAISEVIGFCNEILYELNVFYSIKSVLVVVFSLIRQEYGKIWFEILVSPDKMELLKDHLGESIEEILTIQDLNEDDAKEWYTLYNLLLDKFGNASFIRMNKQDYYLKDRSKIYDSLIKDVVNKFSGQVLPHPVNDGIFNSGWLFAPKIIIKEKAMKWHPLLSNYLFTFMLSDILRYHPHVLGADDSNSFIAEAWCNQSPVATLRYFLMEISKKRLRIN